jgi:MoaA/NifB/PqqE/SkfB family radical SAM enzyme
MKRTTEPVKSMAADCQVCEPAQRDEPRIADCETCGIVGPICCRDLAYDVTTDLWTAHLFCDGKCAAEWRRLRSETDEGAGI